MLVLVAARPFPGTRAELMEFSSSDPLQERVFALLGPLRRGEPRGTGSTGRPRLGRTVCGWRPSLALQRSQRGALRPARSTAAPS